MFILKSTKKRRLWIVLCSLCLCLTAGIVVSQNLVASAATEGKVTVTFDASGGKFTDGKIMEVQEMKVGDTYGELPTPSRNGVTFQGWYTEATDGTKVETGETISSTDSVLYAHWSYGYGLPTISKLNEEMEVAYGQYPDTGLGIGSNSNMSLTYQWYVCDDKNGSNATSLSEAKTYSSFIVEQPAGIHYYYIEVIATDKRNGTIYSTTSHTIKTTVKKATIRIWRGPTAGGITSGQKLSDSQLSTTSASVKYDRSGTSTDVLGSFSWKNPDTVLQLSDSNSKYEVIFTPNDPTRFETATTSVSVKVTCSHANKIPATCTKAETCADCNATFGNALGHEFEGGTWMHDESQHWKKCSRCDAENTTNKVGHTIVTDSAVKATCTATGLTEGTHCSICEKVLTAQTSVDALGHDFENGTWMHDESQHWKKCSRCEAEDTTNKVGHTIVTDSAVEATCTATGLTEGTHCSICGTILTTQSTVDALGHDFENGTWMHDESQHWKKCSRCDVEDTVKNTHDEAVDAAVDATCTSTGLTEGTHCSICGTILTTQRTVDALGHDFEGGTWMHDESQHWKKCSRCTQEESTHSNHTWNEGVITTEPTLTTKGVKTYTCEACAKEKMEDIYAVIVTPDNNGTATANPTSASEGTEVTLTATPNSGYDFDKWVVKSNNVTLTEEDQGKATIKFTMPAEAVEIQATFKKKPSGGGGSSSSSRTEVTTTGETNNKVTNSPTEVKNETKTDETGNNTTIATITVSSNNQREILRQAKANKSGEIIIKVPQNKVTDGAKLELNLEKSFIESILNDTDADLTIQTPEGERTFTQDELKEIVAKTTGNTVTVDPTSVTPSIDENDQNENLIKGIGSTSIVLRSKLTKNKKVFLTWTKSKGYKVDYFEFYRSVKKNSGYGTTAFFLTKDGSWSKYLNTKSVKKGNTYYYKLRGVRIIDGKKYYTQWSNKAWRTVK